MDQEALRRSALLVLFAPLALVACDFFKKKPPEDPPPDVQPAPSRTPQTFDPAPLNAFSDASTIDGKTPLEQARVYESNGQLWLARLVLEPKALASDGTKEEATLLGSICARQGDAACVDRCSAKVGKKLTFDAGVAGGSLDAGVHKEPDTDAARARAMFLSGDLKGAHELLEPKLLANKANKEEIRILKQVCEKEENKMCVALCDAKLR